MMRSLVLIFCFAFSFLYQAHAESYVAGKHYLVSDMSGSAQPELREYFSLYCPHCFSLERHMVSIKSDLPKGMTFERSHVDFLSGISPDVQALLTKSYIAAENIGKGEAFVGETFRAIHIENKVIKDKEGVLSLMENVGVPSDMLEDNIIAMQQSAMQADQDMLVTSGLLKGVPTLVVNGKYIIVTTELDNKDPISDLKKLIYHLQNKDFK
jgi:thiol:disulfide interchange protein DsbA